VDCPKCGRPNREEYRFCEIDGTPLAAAPAAPTHAGCRCGAPADAVDEQGWCSACGRRAARPSRDHREISCGPHLCAVSDRGKKHADNEDDFALATEVVDGRPVYVAVVCDGVSSSSNAAEAARAASAVAREQLMVALRAGFAEPEASMRRAIRLANEAVCRQEALPGLRRDPPSTTIAAVAVRDRRAAIGWVGDSRVYCFSAQGGEQLTVDHAAGHALTRCLGAPAPGDDREAPEPDVKVLEVPEGAWLLVCTDGLWNYAPEPERLAALAGDADPARRLVEFAVAAGGKDNVTVAVLRL